MPTNFLTTTTKMEPIYWIYDCRGLKGGMTKNLSEKVFGIKTGYIHAKAQFEKHTAVNGFLHENSSLHMHISASFDGHCGDYLVNM